MRGQTEVKEKKTKNISLDIIVSKLKYDFMKNLAQLQCTLPFTLILMAKSAKNPFTQCHFTIFFQTNFKQVYIISVSGKCVRVMFKKVSN